MSMKQKRRDWRMRELQPRRREKKEKPRGREKKEKPRRREKKEKPRRREKKEKQRAESHGKEFAAQEGLLAKLVAAPGEYNRSATGIASLEELLDEEEKERKQKGIESEDEEDGSVSDDLSSQSGQVGSNKNENVDDTNDQVPVKYTAESVTQMLENSNIADK